MIRSILAVATGDPTDAATFATALAIARPAGAHLDVLHVRADPISAGIAMATGAGSGAMTAGLIEQLEADAAQHETRARDGFTRFCAAAGLAVPGAPASQGSAQANTPSAEFHVETGREAEWVAVYGRSADLVIASRWGGEALARSTLETVLLETGRPLLIPGPDTAPLPEPIGRIAIAWKPVPQAARAVALAMPFLDRAKEVVIATVEESVDERDEIDRLSRYLGRHGLTPTIARMRPGPDGAAATLLSAIAGRADLLVMGGYGHSRLREWVFGGFTDHVLAGAPLPVLMVH
ncbi:MAG: universal stress protein [Alphaproteobacteria bacterium]